MYSEDELLPLSGLQHLVFCPRQWALIHLEQAWAENRLTAEGRERHDRVHEEGNETRRCVRTVRSLPVHSFALGVAGVCDVVEFPLAVGAGTAQLDPDLDWLSSDSPFDSSPTPDPKPQERFAAPVEYKRGKPKVSDCDRVQLCAQAICIEEMTGCFIPSGALYYWETRRREPVEFSLELRGQTSELAAEMHRLYRAQVTPPAVKFKGCKNCSLKDLCLPGKLGDHRSARRYLEAAIRRELREGPQ